MQFSASEVVSLMTAFGWSSESSWISLLILFEYISNYYIKPSAAHKKPCIPFLYDDCAVWVLIYPALWSYRDKFSPGNLNIPKWQHFSLGPLMECIALCSLAWLIVCFSVLIIETICLGGPLWNGQPACLRWTAGNECNHRHLRNGLEFVVFCKTY